MSGLRTNPDFRPNSRRGIFVTGAIDQSTMDRLTPQIMRILGDSAAPVTVFIDSPGGMTFFAEGLYRTLKSADQDSAKSLRLITVGLNMAASAACDLLIAGDYAVVHPHTIILCHGVRQNADGITVTREAATDMAKSLATSNEQYAIQMATNAISRFIFRFAMLRSTFDSIRAEENRPESSDSACFLYAIRPHISPRLFLLAQKALIARLDNDLIDVNITEKFSSADHPTPKNQVEFEAFLLKSIIDYQVEDAEGEDDWSFRENGLPDLEEKFAILLNSHEAAHQSQIAKLVARWGELLLSEEDSATFAAIPAAEKEKWLTERVNRTIRSLWFLFVAICRLLQQNENYLTAEEAYWIGLVDEIIGRTELPSPRLFVEYEFDATADEPETGA